MTEHFKSKLFIVGQRVHLIPRSWEGLTVGSHVFYYSDKPPQWLRDHEAVHVKQFAKFGLFGYFVRYWWGYITNGFDYHKIPFEIEAYNVSAPEGYNHGRPD